jgi:hypothetical protein
MLRGLHSLANGIAYEKKVADAIRRLKYNGNTIIVPEGTAGANSKNNDIMMTIQGREYAVEAKNRGAFEGGGKRFQVTESGLRIPEDGLHKDLLGDYIPWGGRVPSFLRGNKTLELWNLEKDTFKDEYLHVAPETICQYYRQKGASYIQIEDKGVYHTGEDCLSLNVPLFSCEIKIRIRCKRHTSGPMPSSVQASFVYNRKTIVPSPYDFVFAPPPCFTRIEEVAE